MKKLRIAVSMIILAFSFSVKASVSLEIRCNSNIIQADKIITCEGNLLYEQEGINDIEFTYQTNLNVEFIDIKGFTLSKLDNKILIHTNRTLFDMITNSTKIMEFNLYSDNLINDVENLVINNIKVNNSDSILITDISKSFNVLKSNELDNICTLDSISVDNIIVNDFSKEKLEYYVQVNNEIIFIDGVRTSDKSSATGFGNVRVPSGETIERDIKVVAEDKTEKIYKLFITNTMIKEKEEIKDEKIISNDNTLKKLELYNNNTKIKFDYNNKSEVYNIDIIDIDLITIKAELNDNKAMFVKDYGPRDIKLNLGYNKVLIKIVSENNNERVITLNINYQDSSLNNNELISLIINDREINLDKEDLEITLPNDIEKTIISAIPKNDKSLVKYHDCDLIVGNNKVTIEVISASGISKIYDINVIREEKEIILADTNIVPKTKENNVLIKIFCYSIFIIGITALISSIIYFNKKKKALYYEII